MTNNDNYIDRVAVKIGELCEMDVNDPLRLRLLRIYALLALTVGKDVTWEHVHDAWAVWKLDINPEHRWIVPFDDLPQNIMALDAKYADAIRMVAIALRKER